MRLKALLLLFFCTFFPWHAFSQSDDTALEVWANEAIVATYTYTAQNYLERQKAIAHYFTAAGWIAYTKALQLSGLPQSVQKNGYAVSAVALLPPTITALSTHHWQAVMPLLVLYKNAQYQQKQTLEVTLDIISTPAQQGIRGLAINSLQSKITTPPCTCMSK